MLGVGGGRRTRFSASKLLFPHFQASLPGGKVCDMNICQEAPSFLFEQMRLDRFIEAKTQNARIEVFWQFLKIKIGGDSPPIVMLALCQLFVAVG